MSFHKQSDGHKSLQRAAIAIAIQARVRKATSLLTWKAQALEYDRQRCGKRMEQTQQ